MVTDNNDWIIIGISGATCGGKTTLANKLKDALAPVYVFHQDPYFYPDDSPKHVKVADMEHNNYDILSSLDMDRMHEDILATLNGDTTKAHGLQEDVEGRTVLPGKKFLVLEGFILLNYKPIFDLCTLRYYITLDYDECVRRRNDRVYDPPDIPGYFEQCVWPEHVRYKSELEGNEGVAFIDGTRSIGDTYNCIMNDVLRSEKLTENDVNAVGSKNGVAVKSNICWVL